MKKYFVFLGSFGSGKSELAINFAVQKSKEKLPCTLVDLDVINPYFRSSERGELLQKYNVRLISPPYALQKIEIMSLSPEVYSVFAQAEGTVIFDAGGDPAGAVALGQYKPYFGSIPSEQLHVLMVLNPFRPLAETSQKAKTMMEQLQKASRLKITGLINNANLVNETTLEELKTGYEVTKELSEMTGVPVYATTGTRDVLETFAAYIKEQKLNTESIGRLIPIEVMMHRTWDKFLNEGL